MSEPQSSGDVDRVLDNIRKLVSTKGSERPAPRERLMLTSDLRVPQKDDTRDDTPKVDGPPLDLSLEARIAHLESAVASEQGFEPDGSEAQEPPLDGIMPDLAALFREEKTADVSPPDPEGSGQAAGPDPQPVEADHPVPAAPEASVPATQSDHVSVTDSWAFDVLPSAPSPQSSAPEQAVTDDGARADPTRSQAAPSTDPMEDDQAIPFIHATHPRPSADRPAEAIGSADDDATLLDEDMLRELVAEIVREELSGALGERITRNVKKLVRREIMRALAAREFD